MESAWDKRLHITTVGRDDLIADRYHHPYEPTPYSVLLRLADSGYIGKGDVVLFAYDGDGYVKGYEIAMDYDAISAVLESGTYDWNTGFRYFKPYYDTDTTGTNKRTEANMYNVLQVITDEEPNKLYVTKNAPDASEDYESINITSSTKIVRYDKDLEEFVSTAPDSSQNLTINDIYDIENYGSECSKIMVVSYYSSSTADPAIRFIVMY
jgi:hypothetical protein